MPLSCSVASSRLYTIHSRLCCSWKLSIEVKHPPPRVIGRVSALSKDIPQNVALFFEVRIWKKTGKILRRIFSSAERYAAYNERCKKLPWCNNLFYLIVQINQNMYHSRQTRKEKTIVAITHDTNSQTTYNTNSRTPGQALQKRNKYHLTEQWGPYSMILCGKWYERDYSAQMCVLNRWSELLKILASAEQHVASAAKPEQRPNRGTVLVTRLKSTQEVLFYWGFARVC